MNFTTKTLLIMCIWQSVISFTSNAQRIEKLNGGKYEYEGKIYEYKQMEEIFAQNEISLSYYHNSLKDKKTSKALAIVAYSSLFSSVIISGITMGSSLQWGNNSEQTSPPVPLFLIPPISLIAAIAISGSAGKNRTRSIESFNQDYGIRLPKKDKPNLELFIGSGIGLKMTF